MADCFLISQKNRSLNTLGLLLTEDSTFFWWVSLMRWLAGIGWILSSKRIHVENPGFPGENGPHIDTDSISFHILVGGLEHVFFILFPHLLGIMIPIDELFSEGKVYQQAVFEVPPHLQPWFFVQWLAECRREYLMKTWRDVTEGDWDGREMEILTERLVKLKDSWSSRIEILTLTYFDYTLDHQSTKQGLDTVINTSIKKWINNWK